MIAYITSIGETTLDLCRWSLERNGFTVRLITEPPRLADKLKVIYEQADDDFVRVDADVIPNRSLTPDVVRASYASHQWWIQFMTYDWFKQDITHGGVQFIRKEALPALRANIKDAMGMERPESHMYRIKEFYSPRRCDWHPAVMGLQNYKNDIQRIKETKQRRNQTGYDFELAKRIYDVADA